MTTWVVFAAYFAALLVLGEVFARLKVRSLDDYLLSSREHGTAVTTASLTATVIGAGSTIGAAGVAYYVGVSAGWYLLSAGPGLVLLAYTLAPALRELSVYTIPEYVGRRYGTAAELLAAGLGVLALVLFLSAQFYAMGALLSRLAPIPLEAGITATALLVVIYTWRGGNWAVHWSDSIQVVLVVAGVGAAAWFALEQIGGLDALAAPPQAAGFPEIGESWFHPITERPVSGWDPFALGNTVVAWIVMSTTWHFAMQSTAQRIFSSRDPATVRRSCLAAAAASVPLAALFAIVGMSARVLFPELSPPGEREVLEQVLALPALIEGVLPPVVAGIVLAALVAIVMSTCDSALLGTGTVLVKDLLPRWRAWRGDGTGLERDVGAPEPPDEVEGPAGENRRKDEAGTVEEDEEGTVEGSRRVVAIVGLLGLGAALLAPGLVQILEMVAAVYTVALFAPLLAGLYWDRASGTGAVASMVVSGTAAAAWRLSGLEDGTGLHMLNVALPLAAAALVVGSLVRPRAEAVG